jgi:hypothetical protein
MLYRDIHVDAVGSMDAIASFMSLLLASSLLASEQYDKLPGCLLKIPR